MPRPLRSDTARAVANLAIELGDPGRMAKARRLHRKGAVTGVDIVERSAAASVIDGDDSFTVEILLGPNTVAGEVPRVEDVSTTCDCDEGGDPACRHVLAGVLGVAEAFEVNARHLLTWTDAPRKIADQRPSSPGSSDFFGEVGHRRSIPQLTPRGKVDFPALEVEATAAGPVFEDAIAAIRRVLTPYRAHR